MATDILTALGAGSGLDVKNIVSQLVAAEKAPRQALIDARAEKVEARVSAQSTFRAALDALVSALDSRVSSGDLSGIPATSDISMLTFTVEANTTVQRQSLEIKQLARAQTLSSAIVADASAPVGQGTLTFRFGTVGDDFATTFTPGTLSDLQVVVGPDNDSLTGLKDAINAAAHDAGAPVQAQILTDAGGSRLVLRGTTGEAAGFIVETSGDPMLDQFAFHASSAGLGRDQAAQDALVALEGVTVRRASNTISDLIDGATLTLHRAEPGTTVLMEAVRSTSQLSETLRDLASALTELVTIGRELSTGATATASAAALASDSNTRRALNNLGSITSAELLPPDGDKPIRLVDIGLTVDRYGKFLIDETIMAKAVTEHPAAVEALIGELSRRETFTTAPGALRQIAADFATSIDGSQGQTTALQKERASITEAQQKLDAHIENYNRRLSMQFGALDVNVNRYKSIQSFMQQQIDLWTKPRT